MYVHISNNVHVFYMLICITACPIKGQIRKKCASHPSCHRACNSSDPLVCPLICIPNGCECPAGTVIDWKTRECVRPNQCEGKNIVINSNNTYFL